MKLESLQELFVHELQDLYSAEQQILEALPRMAQAASAQELRHAFEAHHRQTEEHVARLEQIFEGLEQDPAGKHCKGMEGLIKEGQELMKEDAAPEVLDAGLIAAAQKVEHYEIAGYGTARTYARILGNEEAARILQQTLDEEGATDEKLSALAESQINVEAAEG